MADLEAEARQRVSDLPYVSRETLTQLDRFVALVERWSQKINLVARADLDRLWSRHILDSFGLAQLEGFDGLWIDLGSGGGFPAIPLAIVSRETSPHRHFELVESDQRKAVFLREAIRELDLQAEVTSRRIEDLSFCNPSMVTARALSSLDKLLEMTELQRSLGAPMALLKGDRMHLELTEAAGKWHMRYQAERHPLTLNGYILIIRGAKRAELR